MIRLNLAGPVSYTGELPASEANRLVIVLSPNPERPGFLSFNLVRKRYVAVLYDKTMDTVIDRGEPYVFLEEDAPSELLLAPGVSGVTLLDVSRRDLEGMAET